MRNIILTLFRKNIWLNKLHRFLPFDYSDEMNSFNLESIINDSKIIELNINFKKADNNSLNPNREIKIPQVGFYNFKNILVFSENGGVMDKNKTFFKSTFRGKEPNAYNFYYNTSFLTKKKHIKEKATYLHASNNYWHFHFEYLMRLIFLIKNFPEIKIYSNLFTLKWQEELLKVYGVPKDNIIFIDHIKSPYLHFNEFKFLDFFGTRHLGFNDDFSTSYLQKEIFSKTNNILTEKQKNRIFISRKSAKTRKIINENELIVFLNKFNFKVIELEDYTVEEQLNMIYNSEIIIAQHGAGLTNTLICTNSHIIELFNPLWTMNMYALQASSTGNYYYRINCSTKNSLDPQIADYLVDINKINEVLISIINDKS
jgi:hypothetical protein